LTNERLSLAQVRLPDELMFGRSPPALPSPLVSTPVMTVNGRPDWPDVTPEICQPPAMSFRRPSRGPGISHR
jgi:hypothetical protein